MVGTVGDMGRVVTATGNSPGLWHSEPGVSLPGAETTTNSSSSHTRVGLRFHTFEASLPDAELHTQLKWMLSFPNSAFRC